MHCSTKLQCNVSISLHRDALPSHHFVVAEEFLFELVLV